MTIARPEPTEMEKLQQQIDALKSQLTRIETDLRALRILFYGVRDVAL